MAKRPTQLDLIDIKEMNPCKVKINGKDDELVAFIIKNGGRYYAQVTCGWDIEISEDEYNRLRPILEEHLRKYA